MKNKCEHDDFCCRVYEICGTKECKKRANKLRVSSIEKPFDTIKNNLKKVKIKKT